MYSHSIKCRDLEPPEIKINYNIKPLEDNIYINQKINTIKKQYHIHSKYNKKTNKYSFLSKEINLLLNNEINSLMENVLIQDRGDLEIIKETKNKINNNYFKNEWDKIKKFTNPFEFIYCIPKRNEEYKTISITTIDPLSRSFFKMIEMSNIFLKELILDKKSHNTLHLAEGPGGFIEAYAYLRKKYSSSSSLNDVNIYNYLMNETNNNENNEINMNNHKNDIYYGITLINKNYEVPGWKKSSQFLKKYKNVKILNGIDGTGDLYNINNIKYLIEKFKYNKVKLVTGDGGFDFSIDYNLQEFLATKLLLSQIVVALGCLEKNGSFICKFYDMNNKLTIELIYILQCFFNYIHIFKPKSSRLANSEKYIICKGFKKVSDSYLLNLIKLIERFNDIEIENKKNINIFTNNICKKLCNNNHNNYEIERLDINNILQIKSINTVLNYVENHNLDNTNLQNNNGNAFSDIVSKNNQNIENKSIENKSIENKSIENKSIENKSIEHENNENNNIENKSNYFKKCTNNIPPNTFFDHLKKLNKEIINIQIKNINYTIDTIKKKNKGNLNDNWYIETKNNLIHNAVDWCKEFDIPFKI